MKLAAMAASRRMSSLMISWWTTVSHLRTRLSCLGALSFPVSLTQATWASAIQPRMVLRTRTLATCLATGCHTRKRATITRGFTSAWREHRMGRRWPSIFGAWPRRVSFTRWDLGPSTESAPTQWSGSGARGPCPGTMRGTFRSSFRTHSATSMQRLIQHSSPGRTLTHLTSLWSKRRSWCGAFRRMKRFTSIEKFSTIVVRGVQWNWLPSQRRLRCSRREKSSWKACSPMRKAMLVLGLSNSISPLSSSRQECTRGKLQLHSCLTGSGSSSQTRKVSRPGYWGIVSSSKLCPC